METTTEELVVEDGVPWVKLTGAPPYQAMMQRSRAYHFELCRKPFRMVESPIDQFWMALPGLYGTRNKVCQNHKQVIECYWSLCKRHLTHLNPQQQDTYLLANLLPYTRDNGSRRVFEDAKLRQYEQSSKKGGRDRTRRVAMLDALLMSGYHEQLTELEFRDRTGDLLGPPEFDDETRDVYDRYVTEVLTIGRWLLDQRDPCAIHTVTDEWQAKMNSVGRHRGRGLEKSVLNILSYEARAAFHTCYSAVWNELLQHLTNRYSLCRQSVLFHRLWHFGIKRPSEERLPADFHLFHGHLFALHPASGQFLSTETGVSLVGQWLSDPHSVSKYQQLLHGLFVAMYQYDDTRQMAASDRKITSAKMALSFDKELEERLVK